MIIKISDFEFLSFNDDLFSILRIKFKTLEMLEKFVLSGYFDLNTIGTYVYRDCSIIILDTNDNSVSICYRKTGNLTIHEIRKDKINSILNAYNITR